MLLCISVVCFPERRKKGGTKDRAGSDELMNGKDEIESCQWLNKASRARNNHKILDNRDKSKPERAQMLLLLECDQSHLRRELRTLQ